MCQEPNNKNALSPHSGSVEKGLSRAAALCSGSEQCSADVYDKLLRWGVEEKDAAEIMARLVSEGFINDLRYARAFTHDRIRYHRWGRIKIAYALRQKRIPPDIIDEAISAIDDEWADEYEEALRKTIGKNLDTDSLSWSTETDSDWKEAQKAKAKIMRHAASHGFTSDEIMTIMRTE